MTTEDLLGREELVHPEEFPGALVVDSEAYIYGRTRKPEIRPDRIALEVYREKTVEESFPDVAALKTALLGLVRKTFGKPSMQDLYKLMQRELNKPGFADEDFVEYAKKKNIIVPMIHSTKLVEEKKGTVETGDIDAIGKSDLGICLLLKKPLEAQARGLKPSKAVPFRSFQELGPKMVIDASARILGSASDIWINKFGEPQIKLKKEARLEAEVPDIEALERHLLSQGEKRERLYRVVAEAFNVKQASPEHLVQWAKNQGYSVPTKKSHETRELEFQYLIPWKKIRRIGDVVLLDIPIEKATQ